MPKSFTSILLLSLAILFPRGSFSQGVDVQWGDAIKETRHSEILNFVGHDENGYYVIKGPRKSPTLDDAELNGHYPGSFLKESLQTGIVHLSSDMKPVKETIFEGRKKNMKHLATYKVGENVFMFSSTYNRESKFREIYVQSVGREDLVMQNNLQKVAQIANTPQVLDTKVDFTFSSDSSYIMVYTNTQSRRKDPDRFGFYVFDHEMNPIWSKEVVLPIRESQFQIIDFIVDSRGNTYLIAKHYFSSEREKIKGKPGYQYVVYGYLNEGDEEVAYILNLRRHFLSDLHLEVSSAGDLICAGFYSENGLTSATGTFFFTIDAETKEIKQKSLYEFDLDFLTMNLTERRRNKLKKQAEKGKMTGLNKFDIRDLVTREDGGMMLVAEQYFVREISNIDPNWPSAPPRYKYYYNDIIVINISQEGNIEWATKIPKRQVSVNDEGYYSSYAMMIKGQNLHFIYNDHKMNIEEQRTERLKNFQLSDEQGIIAMATVDKEGNVSREPLFPNSAIQTICRPKMCSQINKSEMLIYGRNGRKTQFGRIVFD